MQSISNNVYKIGVFIDGNLIIHTSNYYYYTHSIKKRLSLKHLLKYIRAKVAKEQNTDISNAIISETHYFRGRLNASDALQRTNQLYNDRVFDDILICEGVNTHYLPLINVNGKKEERGADVWLSLEALELTILKKLDYVVLIASDTDYVPLIRKINSYGVKTVLLYWDFEYINDDGSKIVTKTSSDLCSCVSYPLSMHDIIEEGFNRNDNTIKELFSSKTSYDNAQTIEKDEKKEAITQTKIDQDNDIEIGEILSLKQGYGFIKYPNNNLFFHYQDVIGDFSELIMGDTVEFTVKKNSDGNDVAKEVKKVIIEDLLNPEEKQDEVFFDWNTLK